MPQLQELKPPETAPPGPARAVARPPRGPIIARTRRQRKTRRSVRLADVAARVIITGGGLGVVVMFVSIVLFLVLVALPMFKGARITKRAVESLPPPAVMSPETQAEAQDVPDAPVTAPAGPARAIAMGLDENVIAAWLLDSAGQFSTYRLGGAELVGTQAVSDVPVTAVAERRGNVAIARADGTVMLGRIGFSTGFVSDIPDAAEALREGNTMVFDGGVAELARGRLRVTRPSVVLGEPMALADGEASPVRLIDYLRGEDLEAVVALLENGRLAFDVIRKQQNMMTGEVATRLVRHQLPASTSAPAEPPVALLLGKNARHVYVIYPGGYLTRYDTTIPASAVIAEETDLTAEGEPPVTSATMLLGNVTLIIGDASGGVSGWFAAPFPDDASPRVRQSTTDALRMVRAHDLPDQAGAISAVAASSRDRQFITADANGEVLLRHMTSEATQARLRPFGEEPVRLVALAPKNDAMAALSTTGEIAVFSVANPHPDGSLHALFMPVHYEGRAEAEHFWQSSAGSDAAELKFGLIPLIFGTIKATVYAMLFAVPLAILAAIYSAEFMQPRVRSVVKPVVELMAGLPSVVLGFIAALVLAPLVEDIVPSVLLVFVAVPVGVMIFGFIWQLLPPRTAQGAPVWLPFALMMLAVILMGMLAFVLGPFVERVLFYGDFRAWVDSRVGTGLLGAMPGWILILTPLVAVALVLSFNLWLRHRLPLFDGRRRTRMQLAIADLGRFAITAVLSVALAVLLGALASAIGLDLRGGILDTYVQRNAMVVGIIMGFAIIPIIYTVSEDALSSVPNTLRSAAYGAGATPWQTAVRVVLPVAASGIFSACMIGFGRAAGETMIVLMAAGNTPILEWNIFSGLRTLSANIAVELPEAAVGSTHYRVLYLSALVLFAITFLVNTTAEIVRLRFRKRAFQL